MTNKLSKLAFALAGAAMMTVAGCGGGGSNGDSTGGSGGGDVVVSTTSVPVTVIDGAIEKATVCLDKNLNGICDSGEPSGKTDSDGKVTLQIDIADANKYPILAVVGIDAVDKDHGPVKTPFTMQAPADKPAVVSPLTTLVQSVMASTGASSADAEASIKAQTGLNVSLFADFSKDNTADSQAAGTVARMVVLTTQQQSTLLSSTVGSSAIDGAVIKQADLDKIIQNRLLEILPALLTALADPSVLNAAPADKDAVLLAQANALVNSPDTGIPTTAVTTLVAINNQTASPSVVAETPTAGGTLRSLKFTDSANWSVRALVSTLAQNTPDASNNVKYVSRRYNSVGGAVAAWNNGGSPNRQADLHFNGSSWVGCALNSENTSTVRDAKGNSIYNDCDKMETGSSNRAVFDIAGRPMIDVYNQITAAGYTNLSITSAPTVLGTTQFPVGAKLLYQSNTPLTTAVAYYPGSSSYVTQYSAAVSSGGIASTQGATVGCNSSEFKNTNGTASATLEGMIGAMTGTPCVFGQGQFTYNSVIYTSPDAVDEAWGNSTVGIGTLGTAPVGFGSAPGFYSGNTKLRVAFKGTGTNPVTYYACKERFNNGSTRNCTEIGTGTYTIATQGDARVMALSNPPLIASSLGYQRVFVERNGKIYAGYQNNPTTTKTARLNLVATNALASQLGLPTVDPEAPLALTRTSYSGEWVISDPVAADGSTTIRIDGNGNVTCTWIDSTGNGTDPCTLTFTDLAKGAFTLTDDYGIATGTLNFLTGAASGTFADTDGSNGSFVGVRR